MGIANSGNTGKGKEYVQNVGNIIDFVANRTGNQKKVTKEIVDEIINVLAESLSAKQIVTIAGLGVFKPATRSAREGRNPKTGETIQIPAKNTIKFKPSKKLREAINS